MKLYSVLIASILVFVVACQDVFEEDIEKSTIKILGPSFGAFNAAGGFDTIKYKDYKQTFWWEKTDGISKYNLQIVKGTFNIPTGLIVDTNITGNRFTYSLGPGLFEWRIKGVNSGSETAFSYSKILIDSAAYDESVVQLQGPLSNSILFGTNMTLSWVSLHNSKKYVVEIDTVNGEFTPGSYFQIAAGSKIEYKQLSTYLSQNNILTGNKIYRTFSWRVKGNNGVEDSGYSDIWEFTIVKQKVDLREPANNSLITASTTPKVQIRWDPLNMTGVKYMVWIYDKNTNATVESPYLTTENSYQYAHGGVLRNLRVVAAGIDQFNNLTDTVGLSRTVTIK
jgi:hypothetical protein